jgi:general secretion pathway protein A
MYRRENPMYADFYGLSAEAFLLTPDHRFFFGSSVHSQAMAFLNYGISRGEGFIVITGDIGAGKTTMVGRLAASIDDKRIISAHVVTTHLTGTDLLRFVASAFGLTDLPDDKAMLLVRLQDFFRPPIETGSGYCCLSTKHRIFQSTRWKNCGCFPIFKLEHRRHFKVF